MRYDRLSTSIEQSLSAPGVVNAVASQISNMFEALAIDFTVLSVGVTYFQLLPIMLNLYMFFSNYIRWGNRREL